MDDHSIKLLKDPCVSQWIMQYSYKINGTKKFQTIGHMDESVYVCVQVFTAYQSTLFVFICLAPRRAHAHTHTRTNCLLNYVHGLFQSYGQIDDHITPNETWFEC